MTWNGRVPTSRNKRQHTAYERQQSGRLTTSFDHDARSCLHAPGIWPTHVSDIESLTLLSGLESQG